MQVLVAERDARAIARHDRRRGADAVALEVHGVAEAVGVLVDAVQANRHGVRHRPIDVAGHALVAVAAGLQRHLVDRLEPGLLRHAVDDAAAAAPAEDHRIGSLQRLDALQVVEIPVVLHVIADAVHVEVGRRVVAADDHLVAVVLALVLRHARHVAHDVADAHHQLVLDQRLRHDRDRLRHVAQQRRRLRRRGDDGDLVALGRVHGHLVAEAGDLEDEVERDRAGIRRGDVLRGRGEAVGLHGEGVGARREREREVAPRVRHGAHALRLTIGHGGDAGAGDRRFQWVEHAPLYRESGSGGISGTGRREGRGEQQEDGEQGNQTTHERLRQRN